MLGCSMRHTKFLYTNVAKFGPSAAKFAWSSVSYISTKTSYAVGNIVVKVFLLEGDREMPYIGGEGSKQTINIYGEDLSKMFFPFVTSLKHSVQGFLVDGSFLSSKAGIYSSGNIPGVSSFFEVEETSVQQIISTETEHVISDIIIKVYAVPNEKSYGMSEPGSEQTFWVNTNLAGVDLSNMLVPLMNGIKTIAEKYLVNGASFTSNAGVFSPDEDALEQLVGKDAADAGIF